MTRLQAAIRKMELDTPVLDVSYPQWARRSNPIVRRHLGVYIKTIPPQFGSLFNLFAIQAVLVILTVPLPFIFNVTLPLITVSILLLPLSFYLYCQTLLAIAHDAAMAMLKEVNNNTLHLLRTTPLTSLEILLGKIAASLWRRADDLGIVLLSAGVFGLPAIIMLFANNWPPDEYPYISQIAMVITFGSSIVRLVIEPFMVAALGVMVGAAMPMRAPAVTSTGLLVFFYFLLINLARLLPLSLGMRIIVEAILPLVLPLAITWGALRMAIYFMSRD